MATCWPGSARKRPARRRSDSETRKTSRYCTNTGHASVRMARASAPGRAGGRSLVIGLFTADRPLLTILDGEAVAGDELPRRPRLDGAVDRDHPLAHHDLGLPA